ncbi:NAD(P)/FAD-dependent oxidoreductase [Phaeobacter sp. HF9A]|uniref:flavin-containing monooxygenase n=1 Tax=Phaeobacter sp. HF9A TaxID=2721561 RepID=UPI00142FA2A9|nr:NAD(P)/FAD-dependent oxidoreductase [Phaeobacter sp. HF9A]NIZ13077.1 NAD(P)-binding domain-containing protein [Phaeobacter sp. HF9A]
MLPEKTNTVVVGGGQAGLAMSEHLSNCGIAHVVLERARIAERWRTERWDSLVANGPAWHDRFPSMEFSDTAPDAFATKESVASYMEDFAAKIAAPVHCGVDVKRARPAQNGTGFVIETSQGTLTAQNIVAATGPFQTPVIPPVLPKLTALSQMHSSSYRNPGQLAQGAVLVVGAGSSGTQIASELRQAGREVYLSVGPHDRPPRSYRGRDFCWWLSVLGKWEATTPPAGKEHVTIAVSGANGGETVDFRKLAATGITLVGRTEGYDDGILRFDADLAKNIAAGDANYLSLLKEADDYVTREGLDLPQEPEAYHIPPDPACLTDPIRALDLAQAGITTVIWATGFKQDFSWLEVDSFDATGKPQHDRGIANVPGVYFVGLPWLSMRGSAFIWGVWVDAKHLASHIAARNSAKTGQIAHADG